MPVWIGLALLGGTGWASALAVAPRLTFSPEELALAQGVVRSPGLAAFYGANGLRPVFTGPEARARRAALLAAVETAPQHGLPAWRYHPEVLRQHLDDDRTDPALEAQLAGIFALWVQDVSAGILDPRKLSPAIKRAGEGANLAPVLAEFAAAPDPVSVLAAVEPSAPQYMALREALARARGVSAPEGTPEAPAAPGGAAWRAGDRDPSLPALRARLAATGFDAGTAADPTVYDEGLAQAVAAYQKAVGLPDDGIAGARTIARLNAPPSAGPRDLLVAMERWRWLPDDLNEGQSRHIWVNLPTFTAAIVDQADKVTFQTRVVIGKTDGDMQTPEFSDRMEFVVANPRWNVPRSITVKEYLPKLKQNPSAASHLDIVNGAGKVIPRSQIDFGRYTAANFPYRMRQKPSEDNALGIVKFLFPNPWNIYLHDTPSKGLFSAGRRAFSHGCVRIGDPVDLARALLSEQSADPAKTFSAALRGGNERYLTLKPSVPIHLVYFTVLPDANGMMRRYPDIYGRDAAVWAGLSRALTPPTAPEAMASND
ncbi:L,D-transpeptidase family protein [Paracoccus suum]|nr:L,D-transpeptidase family protein [Paracoccus suum]